MPSPPVTLRTTTGEYTISGDKLDEFSLYSSYLVRQRGRWAGDLRPLLSDMAQTATDLGLSEEAIKALAESGLVEVSIPYISEEIGWSARIVPWEFVLSAITKRYRNRPLWVVRHLDVASPQPPRTPSSFMFVQNASVGGFTFDEERKLVECAVEIPKLRAAINPSRAELARRMREETPDVVHLSGVDLRQGRALLGIAPEAEEKLADGLYMMNDASAPDAVHAEELALLLNPPESALKPVLVTCNFYNSAARVAPMIVAQGAGAAIGFQDEFDDSLAERFFGRFYSLWEELNWEMLSAFQESLQKMTSGQLRGTGIVLWSRFSLVLKGWKRRPAGLKRKSDAPLRPIESYFASQVGQSSIPAAPDVPAPGTATGVGRKRGPIRRGAQSGVGADAVGAGVGENGGGGPGSTAGGDSGRGSGSGGAGSQGGAGQPLGDGSKGTGHMRDLFAISVKPPRQINYSLLHNRERLFDAFTITRLKPGYVHGISVQVELFVGQESFPYRAFVDLTADSESADLVNAIHVPLLSRFLRSNRQAIITSLYVEVKYAGETLRQETFPVSLLGIDEWKFDPNDDSRWLASFVLSGDPTVMKIVNAAQRYVTALRDDIGAGFDGYQSIDPEADDPDAPVDLQVRALWSALIHDFPLSYINPPPTFTENSQRLRTPTDVIEAKHGTCIDLALLFAACLEFVEIYPVIFVLKDHAFPGYWRNAESHEKFLHVGAARTAGVLAVAHGKQSLDEYDEVMQLVNQGDLVPLETVWLTQRKSFKDAVDAGMENLINRRDFGALLDVKRARERGVTPLPIMGDEL